MYDHHKSHFDFYLKTEIVSAYLEMKPEDVALKTTLNSLKFFGLS